MTGMPGTPPAVNLSGWDEAVRAGTVALWGTTSRDAGVLAETAVSAAAPILIREALLAVAEKVEQSGSRFEVEDPAGLLAEWLRDLARSVTG